MSTAAAWDTLPAYGPAEAPVRRPRLVVIEGGVIEGGATRPSRTARPAAMLVPRWLRLALTLSVLAVAATMLLGLGGAAAQPAPLGSVEVRPGQTLSEIARAEMPGVLNAEAVAQIQLANNLATSHVTAGQVLVIPGY